MLHVHLYLIIKKKTDIISQRLMQPSAEIYTSIIIFKNQQNLLKLNIPTCRKYHIIF